MEKRALLIAYHYPPVKGSSGLQRALRFSAYLGELGWGCDVLTVHPRAFERTGNDEMGDIPQDVEVVRAQAFDTKRHLAIMGKYPQALALPDRWVSWKIDGVRQGLKLLRRKKHQLIWSTYPIATAHTIGLALAQKTGLPWIADCRDSMSEEGYPRQKAVFDSVRALEQKIVREATAVTFTAPGALAMYKERYPDVPDSRWRIIENGFDEGAFTGLNDQWQPPKNETPLTLLHAGLLYPNERDPRPFFAAIAALKSRGVFQSNPIRVVLRATGHDEVYRPLLEDLNITDLVHLEGAVPYRDALQEMLLADGLLIFQSVGCNHQIPAKAYEYLRAARPILALTDAAGDTASLLGANGHSQIAGLLDQSAIETALETFVERVRRGGADDAKPAQDYSRRAQTAHLAALFDELTGNASASTGAAGSVHS
ncbi:MAG: glycosyltransferase [Gammaproteobacteria bacterium]